MLELDVQWLNVFVLGNLVLTKVSTADSGIYQCIASNIMGTKYGVLSLLVNAQPRVIRPTGNIDFCDLLILLLYD